MNREREKERDNCPYRKQNYAKIDYMKMATQRQSRNTTNLNSFWHERAIPTLSFILRPTDTSKAWAYSTSTPFLSVVIVGYIFGAHQAPVRGALDALIFVHGTDPFGVQWTLIILVKTQDMKPRTYHIIRHHDKTVIICIRTIWTRTMKMSNS